MLDSLAGHMKYAARLIARSPLFAATAILSLAIGIGANTAIFTVANALLIAPTKGIAEMSRLVDIGRTVEGRGFDTVSFATYRDLQQRDSVFTGVYAIRFEPQAFSLGGNDGADRIGKEKYRCLGARTIDDGAGEN